MRSIEKQIKRVFEHRGPLSKQLINGCKQTMNQYRRGWIQPVKQECIEALEAIHISAYLEDSLEGGKLDRELTNEGIQWLYKTLFRKDGTRRRTKDLMYADNYDVFDIVRNFSHFTFDGFERGACIDLVNRWRVHDKYGRSFAYVCNLCRHNPNGYVEFYR